MHLQLLPTVPTANRNGCTDSHRHLHGVAGLASPHRRHHWILSVYTIFDKMLGEWYSNYSGSHFPYDRHESPFYIFGEIFQFFSMAHRLHFFAHFSPDAFTIFTSIYTSSLCMNAIRYSSIMGIKIFITPCFLLILFITEQFLR